MSEEYRSTTRRTILKTGMVGTAALGAPTLFAQEFPSRPIKIIVAFAAGGVSDTAARLFAKKLGEKTGKSFVVENKTGANGALALDYVARSPADGYTLFLGETGPNAIGPALFPRLAELQKEIAAVARLTSVPSLLVSSKKSEIGTGKQLIERVRARPGRHSYSSAGIGHFTHVAFEGIKQRNGLFITHIPYRGGQPALLDVASGLVEFNITSLSTGKGFVERGNVNAIAVTSSTRHPMLPDVPTLRESGLADALPEVWQGIFTPARTSAAVVGVLEGWSRELLSAAETGEAFKAAGIDLVYAGSGEFSRMVNKDREYWVKVVQAGKITADS